MAEVESLTVSLQDSFSAGANAVAQAADKMAAAFDKSAQASTSTDTAVRTRGQSLDSLINKTDGAAAATARLEAIDRRYQAQVAVLTAGLQAQGASATEIADKISRLGVLRDQDAAKAQAQGQAIEQRFAPAVVATDKLASSTRGGAMALRDLAMQSQDAFVQISSGQSIFTTLIQQGSQVSQQMMAAGQGFGALKSAASIALGAIVSPIGLVVTGVAALVGSMAVLGVSAERESERLSNLRQQLRATHDNYTDLSSSVDSAAKSMAASSAMTISEARQAAQTIASAKYFSGTQADIVQLGLASLNLAKIWNTDVGAASQYLRDAINDPAKAAQDLAEKGFPGMNAALAKSVTNMQAAGQGSTALATVLGVILGKTAGAVQDVSPLASAMKGLEERLYGARDGGKSLATQMGDLTNDFLALQVRGLDRLIEGLEKFVAKVQNAGSAVRAANIGKLTTQMGGGTLDDWGNQIPAATAPTSTNTSTSTAATLAQVDQSIRSLLETSAKQYGVDVELLARLQVYENAKPDANGNWAISSDNARGPMQVVPSTAAGMTEFAGQDVNNVSTNINMGTSLFATLLKKYHDPYLAVLAYHDGETLIDHVLKGDLQSNGASYQASTAGRMEAESVAGAYTGTGRASLNSSASSAATVTSGGYDYLSTAPGLSGSIRNDSASILADASKAAEGLNLVQLSREKLIAQQGLFEAALKIPDQTQEQINTWNSALERTRGQLNDTLSPAQAYIRSLTDQASTTAALTEGDKVLAATRQQIAEIERSSGTNFTEAEKRQAEAAAITNSSNALKGLSDEMSRQVVNSNALAAAYDKGAGSALSVTAQQQAFQTLLQKFPQDATAIQTALPALADKYAAVARAAKDVQTAQSNSQARDNITYIDAETSSLGQSEQVRTRELAVLKASLAAHQQYGPTLTEEAKAQVELAGKTVDATNALQHQQATLNEVSSFFDSTFSTISTAITSAFATGELSAIKFGDILKSVASSIVSEFIKLAALNPLKNMLFGGSATTLTDVGGLLGSLFGNGSSVVSSSTATASGASLVSGLLTQGGSTVASSGGGSSGGSSSSGFDSPLTILSSAGSAASFADTMGLTGSGGGLVGGITSKIANAITDAIGNTAFAQDITVGINASGSGLAQVTASIADALGATSDTVASLASTAASIGTALPYVGAAISIVTSLATGNYVSAATTLAGAAIGTAIAPGIGTAIGAALGSLVGSLFGGHAKNSYTGTNVDVQNGHLQAGKSVDQVISATSDIKSINDFGTALDNYMTAVGVTITNANGTIADIGQNIKGLTQYAVTDLNSSAIFGKLSFGAAKSGSTYDTALNALTGMSFDSVEKLNAEIVKIAGFAATLDTLGISLASVGTDLSNIKLNGLSNINPGAVSTVKDAAGSEVSYHGDLRTALNADLSGQTFANVDALDAEIAKVNTWVSQTLPAILTPIKKTSSSLQDSISSTYQTYAQADAQSRLYGLDNSDAINAAWVKALDILQGPYIKSLSNDALKVRDRGGVAASGGSQFAGVQQTMDNFDLSAQSERETLESNWRNVYGDGVIATQGYQDAVAELNNTLSAERVQTYQSAIDSLNSSMSGYTTTLVGYQVRDLKAQGLTEAADLTQADDTARTERLSFIAQAKSIWGSGVEQYGWFQDQLALVDKVHGEERLAIEKSYTDKSIENLSSARSNVLSLMGNLKSYAVSLQTGSSSPLSPLDQYGIASRQFDAVRGAAAAGDYNSASQLQSYAENLLGASRSVYGSGSQYAADFSRVLDAIEGVAANPEPLTVSAQKAIAQDQTDQIVGTIADSVGALQAEVRALRREVQMQQAQTAMAA